MRTTLTLILVALFTHSLVAQEPEPPAQSALHPAIQLGIRINTLKQRWPVAPVLLITRSEKAFLDALELWSQQSRFPILFDDGSAQASEHIARFHRAFAPTKTLLYDGDNDGGDGFSIERIDALIARIWSNGTTTDRTEAWEGTKFTPPGIVVLSHDELSLAAAALAVGHGQVLTRINRRPGPRGAHMQNSVADALAEEVSRALDTTGYNWQSLGDDIDAITLAVNSPVRYRDEQGQFLAISDRISANRTTNQRFAWTSLLQGSASHSVYQAMSSLFLLPRDTWLFNSYSSDTASGAYNVGPAAQALDAINFTTTTTDTPDGNAFNWYRATQRARDESLMFINTSGNARWFMLGNNRLAANALPLLNRPAAVHFIHSFSAQFPHDTRSILGQWERRGSFAYFGSSDEPFLGAFQTPLAVTQRLIVGMPWAAAPRKDGFKIWKLNTFGDPLFTLAKPPAISDIPGFFAQDSFVDAGSSLSIALKARNFETAAKYMRWLNRDEDILRLARAMLQDETVVMSPGFAQIALHTAAHLGEPELATQFFFACRSLVGEDPFLADLYWHVMRPTFPTMTDETALTLLQANIRSESYGRDAADLLVIVKRLQGNAGAKSFSKRMLDSMPDDIQRRQFNALRKR